MEVYFCYMYKNLQRLKRLLMYSKSPNENDNDYQEKKKRNEKKQKGKGNVIDA